ncbi:MAG: hypothetical protein OER96_11975 [Gammaproteobacteria bacterium]|nr:hypothetical protein [Gammaproteobacteria bacterium]
MAKRSKAIALDPREFWLAVEIGIRAGQAQSPAIEQSNISTNAVNPLTRSAHALRDIYGAGTVKFESTMARFAALMQLFSQGVLGEWVKPSDERSGSSDIHPAVIDTAARMRLSDNGKFPVKKFLSAVNKTSRDKYADVPGWTITRQD